MSELPDELERKILFLAQENSSIFDVLTEIRQDYQDDKSFQGLLDIYQATHVFLNRLYVEYKIIFHDEAKRGVDFTDPSINIYLTFLHKI